MSERPLTASPVADGEQLARIILTQHHVRKSDGTVKAEAFLPYKHIELSVIRHRGLTETDLWNVGSEVASSRGRPLVGRADVVASSLRRLGLDAVPADEPPRNHANIIKWPRDKPAQMDLAQQIAAGSTFKRSPST